MTRDGILRPFSFIPNQEWMMDKEIIAQMYDYGMWANRRLLDKAATLTPDQLHQTFTQGAKPILHSFAHLVSAESRWYSSWVGAPMGPHITVEDLPTLDAVRAKLESLYAERRAFLASLTPDDLNRPVVRQVRGQEQSIPLWQTLVHVANHGTQHRSEIAAMLTDAGNSPGDLDMVFYFMKPQ
jgi:uncharacterized damage-inducible protein DinB